MPTTGVYLVTTGSTEFLARSQVSYMTEYCTERCELARTRKFTGTIRGKAESRVGRCSIDPSAAEEGRQEGEVMLSISDIKRGSWRKRRAAPLVEVEDAVHLLQSLGHAHHLELQ